MAEANFTAFKKYFPRLQYRVAMPRNCFNLQKSVQLNCVPYSNTCHTLVVFYGWTLAVLPQQHPCALTMVPSINKNSISRSSDKILKILSKIPDLDQREKQRCTFFQCPYRS